MAKKLMDKARIHVSSSYNNTIITLTDLEGKVLAWATPGWLVSKVLVRERPSVRNLLLKD